MIDIYSVPAGPPGLPSYIGLQPALQFDDLQLVKADTRRVAAATKSSGTV